MTPYSLDLSTNPVPFREVLFGRYTVGKVWGSYSCLLYTSDAADERSSVDLGGRRIIKKKKNRTIARARQRRQKR